MAEVVSITIDSKEFRDNLDAVVAEMPQIAKSVMSAMNRQVLKDTRVTLASRGYDPARVWRNGDIVGIASNLRQYSNDDYTSKVMVTNKSFYARFIESGANVMPRSADRPMKFQIDGHWYTSHGYILTPRPFLRPAVEAVYGTPVGESIADAQLQKELNKRFL